MTDTTASVATEPDFLSIDKAADRLDIHPSTLYRAVREYERTKGRSGLRAGRRGGRGRWQIQPADLAAWNTGQAPKRRTPVI